LGRVQFDAVNLPDYVRLRDVPAPRYGAAARALRLICLIDIDRAICGLRMDAAAKRHDDADIEKFRMVAAVISMPSSLNSPATAWLCPEPIALIGVKLGLFTLNLVIYRNQGRMISPYSFSAARFLHKRPGTLLVWVMEV